MTKTTHCACGRAKKPPKAAKAAGAAKPKNGAAAKAPAAKVPANLDIADVRKKLEKVLELQAQAEALAKAENDANKELIDLAGRGPFKYGDVYYKVYGVADKPLKLQTIEKIRKSPIEVK